MESLRRCSQPCAWLDSPPVILKYVFTVTSHERNGCRSCCLHKYVLYLQLRLYWALDRSIPCVCEELPATHWCRIGTSTKCSAREVSIRPGSTDGNEGLTSLCVYRCIQHQCINVSKIEGGHWDDPALAFVSPGGSY